MKGYIDTGRTLLQESIDEANEEDSAIVNLYSFEICASVECISESISSILCTEYLYSGGAHPTFAYFSINSYLKSGIISEIKPADLFKSKTDWAKLHLNFRFSLFNF